MADFIIVQKEKEQDLITEIKKQINDGYIPVGNFWEKITKGTSQDQYNEGSDNTYGFQKPPITTPDTKMMCQSMYKLTTTPMSMSGGSKNKNKSKTKSKTKTK